MIDPIQDAKDKLDEAQRELDKIMSLAKEMWRLQCLPTYETLDHEWERFYKEGNN